MPLSVAFLVLCSVRGPEVPAASGGNNWVDKDEEVWQSTVDAVRLQKSLLKGWWPPLFILFCLTRLRKDRDVVSLTVDIEDSYTVCGDDCVAAKRGWDEYGIACGMLTKQLVIRWLTFISPYSSAVALGSEMSGGIQDVGAEDIVAIHTESGVRIKMAVGRGGMVHSSHADTHYDPNALPVIQGINSWNFL